MIRNTLKLSFLLASGSWHHRMAEFTACLSLAEKSDHSLSKIGSDWSQIGQIWDFKDKFQNILILKSLRIVPFGCQIRHR